MLGNAFMLSLLNEDRARAMRLVLLFSMAYSICDLSAAAEPATAFMYIDIVVFTKRGKQ